MAKRTCAKCNLDLSQPELVRCRLRGCPLATIADEEPSRNLIGFAAIGALLIVGFSTLPWLTRQSPGQRASLSAGVEGGDDGTNGKSHWFKTLFTVPSPRNVAGVAPAFLSSDFDPRAASRVQNFSCHGALPASRAFICSNWALATTDYNVSLEYSAALDQTKQPAQLRRQRVQWLEQLDRTEPEVNALTRLYDAFRSEIAQS